MTSTRIPIEINEVRLYPNRTMNQHSFNINISNGWFDKEFIYKVYYDRVVFKRPTLDYKNFPTRARKTGNSWMFFITLIDQENRRLEIYDEDINEDEAILYR